MNIYLCKRKNDYDYDEWSEFIICAYNTKQAKTLAINKQWDDYRITCIGKNTKYKQPRIILGSYHAG